MSSIDNRVLNRMGARELTRGGVKVITGGDLHTLSTSFITNPLTSNPDHAF